MDRFERALPHILKHEGGFVDHPRDPGGATNKGITQGTYDAHRKRHGLPIKTVREISTAEVSQIYRQQYWNAIRADDLPDGLAYCVFDAAVNSGPGRAARWLQQVIGAKQDGIVGNETVTRAQAMDAVEAINAFIAIRQAFIRRLSIYSTFGRGWERRIAEVQTQAVQWAMAVDVQPSEAVGNGKAEGPDKATATVSDLLTQPAGISAVAGLVGSTGAVASGDGPVQWGLAAVLVIVALAGVFYLVRRK